MKFDVEVPSLSGVARVEIKSVEEGAHWSAYIAFVSDRILSEACLVLGHRGIPRRFTGRDAEEAEENAKSFLEQNYKVLRMAW
jgi:hypothetical protein